MGRRRLAYLMASQRRRVELAAGDTLYLADGGKASIASVTRGKLASSVDVYNFEVEDFHTYFVASTGVWVNNCSANPLEGTNYTLKVQQQMSDRTDLKHSFSEHVDGLPT